MERTDASTFVANIGKEIISKRLRTIATVDIFRCVFCLMAVFLVLFTEFSVTFFPLIFSTSGVWTKFNYFCENALAI